MATRNEGFAIPFSDADRASIQLALRASDLSRRRYSTVVPMVRVSTDDQEGGARPHRR
jgi:hypothetical protein